MEIRTVQYAISVHQAGIVSHIQCCKVLVQMAAGYRKKSHFILWSYSRVPQNITFMQLMNIENTRTNRKYFEHVRV
jgi:hypothetical protein